MIVRRHVQFRAGPRRVRGASPESARSRADYEPTTLPTRSRPFTKSVTTEVSEKIQEQIFVSYFIQGQTGSAVPPYLRNEVSARSAAGTARATAV